MRIEAVTLREVRMQLKAPFETSFGKIWERRIPLVEIQCDGVSGWGEVTAAEGPFYNSETTDTAWLTIRDFIVPLILGREVAHAKDIGANFAHIRGHEMAKAAVENAIWDIEAQQNGLSLSVLLGGTRARIACGVSLGIQDSTEFLLSKIETELAAGYQRIKIKIKPGKDVEVVRQVRKSFPQIALMVDANSAYRLEQIGLLRQFEQFSLMMIEQPLDWDDIYQHSLLQAQINVPICLDECIHSPRHAESAIKMKACRIINVKLGRVGGHTAAQQIERYCRANDIPVWCGGMLESGVGRAHNIAMSTLPGFMLPGDVSASQRYWDEDIVDPEVTVNSDGTITVPSQPGLGYSVRSNRVDKLTVRKESWKLDRAVVVA